MHKATQPVQNEGTRQVIQQKQVSVQRKTSQSNPYATKEGTNLQYKLKKDVNNLCKHAKARCNARATILKA